ncbi:DUF3168 domain-containing protein [Salibaculum halophilum]|uniref:DUF3168 domain-containing protein n=1 Tax=Salibaculum halophilum TaxID=1914408 RepID=UPI000A0F6004|nr:DUF3168 domain-containing protein [Salibaculum halophilum]
MSYAVSAALQAAVYQALAGNSAVAALSGGEIFDAPPAGPEPALYVTLGPERVRDASDQGAEGATHDFTISVITNSAGFAEAKALAGAVSDALIDAPLALSRGRLVALGFSRARARRLRPGDQRRIDLTFRARVDDT